MNYCVQTNSADETIALGRKVGEILKGENRTISLAGDLGSGKTTFTKGFAQALGVDKDIKSPTFVMLKEYDYSAGKLVHVDAYRLTGDFEDIGLSDYFGNAIVLIEWADNIAGLIPVDALRIEFEHFSKEERKVCFKDNDRNWQRLLGGND